MTLNQTNTKASNTIAGIGMVFAAVLSVLWIASLQAQAAPAEHHTGGMLVVSGLDNNGALRLMVDRGAVLTAGRNIKRVSVAQPDIADVNVISPTRVLITAKKPGNTQIILFDGDDSSQTVNVVVENDLQALRARYKKLFPQARIEVTSDNDTLLLTGQVPNLTVAEQVVALAQPYGKKVLNLTEIAGGQQIMIKVRFAEVSRQAISALGMNTAFATGSFFGGANNASGVNPIVLAPTGGIGHLPQPSVGDLSGTVSGPASTANIYGGGQIGTFFFEAFLTALRQNNLARILAEPNLTVISGQEANFLAGGEYPFPVPQNSGGGTTITINYKEYGVRLKFTPVVLGDGRIRLKVAPEVSQLDYQNAVNINGYRVPGLTQRKLQTVVELGEGETFAVAGLLNNTVTADKQVTPLLGDLPVIGPMFRSVRYQRSETELVVIVTPYVVGGIKPDQVPTLPGEFWRHPTDDQLFFKQDLGGPVMHKEKKPEAKNYFGSVGYTAPEMPADKK